jgi:hypothetical protein
VLLTVGCATTHSMGDAGSAILESRKTVVESIDDRNLRAGGTDESEAKFEIPAGRHSVEVGLPSVSTATPAPADPGKTITVCFDASAGRSYKTQPVFEGDRWRPEIVDVGAGIVVSRTCAEMPEKNAAINDPALAVAAPLEQKISSASLPVPPRPRDPNLPGSGLTGGVGFFAGGDSLYKVALDTGMDRFINAGRGVLVTVGGLWTPVWVDDQVGFGAGASVGWKYDTIEASNGEVSLTRFPLTATVHSLIRFNKRWFTLLSGGLTKEIGGEMSGSGFAANASRSFTGTLGLLGEGGVYFAISSATLGAAVRYSSSRDQFGGSEVDASSLGVIAASQYTF